MKRLVEFPSNSGEPILVEVEDVGLSGETRRGLSTSAIVERAQTSFEDALEKARPMASSLVGKLRTIGAFDLSTGYCVVRSGCLIAVLIAAGEFLLGSEQFQPRREPRAQARGCWKKEGHGCGSDS